MTDKELLELAAKAAGHDVEVVGDCVWINGDYHSPDDTQPWNPLADDGEALRLAVKLAMEIDAGYSDKFIQARTPGGVWFETDIHNSPEAATRRAIVRAAAEIGKETLG